jgi:hypothetical protein
MSQTVRRLAIDRIRKSNPSFDDRAAIDELVIASKLGPLKKFLRLLPEEKYYVDHEAALEALW